MVHVKGIARLLTERLSRDFADSVKYSTLCPWRMGSPSEARRAMPTRRGFSAGGKIGREDMIRLLFAYNRPTPDDVSMGMGGKHIRPRLCPPPWIAQICVQLGRAIGARRGRAGVRSL